MIWSLLLSDLNYTKPRLLFPQWENESLKLSVLQIKKGLFLFLNIVTNFTFRNKVGKVFRYTNIYNFVHTTTIIKI